MQYALRSLLPRVPDLYMLDATIAYPGIPPMGYGQSYYTLRSIGFAGVAPPRVHIKLKLYNVRRDVPIGALPPGADPVDVSDEDRDAFEKWMRGKFDEKDADFDKYYATGSLADAKCHIIPGPNVEHARQEEVSGKVNLLGPREIALPLRLRSAWEWLDAFGFPGPLAWGVASGRLRGAASSRG